MASREVALLQEIRDLIATLRGEVDNLRTRVGSIEQKAEGLKVSADATWSKITDLHAEMAVKRGFLQRWFR